MLQDFDIAGVRAINGLAGQYVWLDAVGIFGAHWLIYIMGALVLAYVAVAWKTSHFEGRVENLWHVCWTFVLAEITTYLIRFFWHRPRPFVTLDHITKLINVPATEASWPSGHATAAFALAFGLFMHNRKWGYPMIALAVIVSLSRVYVGVHYPSDIIAGCVVAFFAAAITAPVKKRIEPYLDLFAVFRKYKRGAS